MVDTTPELRHWMDVQAITLALTRYSLACDERDADTLAEIFHPDAVAVFDADGDAKGGRYIADWICGATAHLRFQQHAMRVMDVDLAGDRARAVAYLTSHQVAFDTPDTTLMMNSRYDVELVRDRDSVHAWRIARLDLLVGTVEHRPVSIGALISDVRPDTPAGEIAAAVARSVARADS